MSDVVIYAARFQPLHLGHMADLEAAASDLAPEETLVIAVVTGRQSHSQRADGPGERLAEAGADNFAADRNPWTTAQRLLAASIVAAELRAKHSDKGVTSCLIPRPSLGWQWITDWFPGQRTWVLPSRGERFDEEKALYYSSRGDSVKRVLTSRTYSGWTIRSAFAAGDAARAFSQLPPSVHRAFPSFRADAGVPTTQSGDSVAQK